MLKDDDFKNMTDPLMIIMNSVEMIKIQYTGVMDENIIKYLNRIEKCSQKIELLLKNIQSKY